MRARQQLHEPVTLALMQQWTGRSAATIARSSRHAVGVAPLQRLKTVRLSLAAGLVRHSSLSLKEIAGRVGYLRLHEFSQPTGSTSAAHRAVIADDNWWNGARERTRTSKGFPTRS